MTLRFVLEIETGRTHYNGVPVYEANRYTGPPIQPGDVTVAELDTLPMVTALLTKLIGRPVRLVQEA
jgi:hypothetical protein